MTKMRNRFRQEGSHYWTESPINFHKKATKMFLFHILTINDIIVVIIFFLKGKSVAAPQMISMAKTIL